MSETKLQIFLTVCVCLVLRSRGHSYCTSSYGREICSFLPAAPGKTPPCALPGLTYCEHPHHYPGQRIQYLIQKWRFDHSTTLIDESKEDFTSYYYPPPSYKYGPSNTIKPENFYPEPIYIPKPNYVFDQSSRVGNTYIPPQPPVNYNTTQLFTGYPDRRHPQTRIENYKYSNDIPPSTSPRDTYGPPNLYTSLSLPQTNPYIKVWNRKDENKFGKAVLIRRKRSTHLRKLKSINFANSTVHERTKRQSALTGQTLCETRSQFIMPRAALNNKGNWMYVVNMPELDNRFTQLVKSETCASQTCSGLCSLPVGYASRCEQKYVQKRLVALEGAGSELYTDVFWFPSCCVCTISNG
ncbi:protein spaetzle 5 [Zophobas morio]|uniref:protein spaetzle 5 n=1 Tax=Zophobas morio TaxID=2755281 RepID=UPI0030826CCE